MKLDTIGAEVHERWGKPSCNFIHLAYNAQMVNYQQIAANYDEMDDNTVDRYDSSHIIDMTLDILRNND